MSKDISGFVDFGSSDEEGLLLGELAITTSKGCECDRCNIGVQVSISEDDYPEFLAYVLKAILGWDDADLEIVGRALQSYRLDDMYVKWDKYMLGGDDEESV